MAAGGALPVGGLQDRVLDGVAEQPPVRALVDVVEGPREVRRRQVDPPDARIGQPADAARDPLDERARIGGVRGRRRGRRGPPPGVEPRGLDLAGSGAATRASARCARQPGRARAPAGTPRCRRTCWRRRRPMTTSSTWAIAARSPASARLASASPSGPGSTSASITPRHLQRRHPVRGGHQRRRVRELRALHDERGEAVEQPVRPLPEAALEVLVLGGGERGARGIAATPGPPAAGRTPCRSPMVRLIRKSWLVAGQELHGIAATAAHEVTDRGRRTLLGGTRHAGAPNIRSAACHRWSCSLI